MQFATTDKGYIIRIEAGEELVSTLQHFFEEEDVSGAVFTGIGATEDATVGMYLPDEQEYSFQSFDQQMEITNLTGNVAQIDDDVTVHMHATLADEAQNAYGGHLKSAVINPTCEIYVTDHDATIERSRDDETNLDLLDLS